MKDAGRGLIQLFSVICFEPFSMFKVAVSLQLRETCFKAYFAAEFFAQGSQLVYILYFSTIGNWLHSAHGIQLFTQSPPPPPTPPHPATPPPPIG